MKKYYYFVSKCSTNIMNVDSCAILESDIGEFDIVEAQRKMARHFGVDIGKIVITFYHEISKQMADKFNESI